MKAKISRVVGVLASIYLSLLVLVGCSQNMLIYHPLKGTESALIADARARGCVPWRDASGAIIGWKRSRTAPPPANRLVVFHGNAGYALHRTYYIDGFEMLDAGRRWEVYLFEYPGYGARTGKPGEARFIAAGESALETLTAADPRPIYLAGESLGSGIATALAGRHPNLVRGVFLITPFARLAEVGAHHFPFLPVRLILRGKWDNIDALSGYRGPAAVLIASEDEVVTAAQGRALYETYAGPKRLWLQSGATHNTMGFNPEANWWREVSEFLLGRASPEG